MKQRILTGVIAAAVFLPLVILGELPFTICTYLLASIALFELLRMKHIKIFSIPGIISLLLLWVLLLPPDYFSLLDKMNLTKVELVLLAVLLFLTYTVLSKNKCNFDDVGFMILSVLYIGIGFFYFIEIREQGLEYIFLALFVIWATDSGAYFIGRKIGKRKLWPEISPNKTVEGSIGGIIVALMVAILFHLFANMEESLVALLFITILLSIFGQIGDLVESALKRQYQVKDSGNILPGHGGILDRFDSLLFVLPILHFLLLM